MFTPTYLKNAKLLLQGVQKFIHYKRDILKPDKLAEIDGFKAELKAAIGARDRTRIDAVAEQVTKACDTALPAVADAGTRDWVESLVTCAVIVFAIRAYFIQPFKIPTGSMQPTLNGIIATRTGPDTPKPNLLRQGFELVARGRNYLRVESPCDGYLVKIDSDVLKPLKMLFTVSRLHFVDTSGKEHTRLAWVPPTQLVGQEAASGASIDSRNSGLWLDREQVRRQEILSIGREGQIQINNPIAVKKGQVLAAGSVDSGDMVLVDKISYHFRRPSRGEVFVFHTKNIKGITPGPGEGSQHYIKRLVGVPGDSLAVKEDGGPLFINGAEAQEKGPRRVAGPKVPLDQYGYHGYSLPPGNNPPPWYAPPTPHRGYFAMGDNSFNSYDSRYWGPVPEENLVGPGLFSLWPFTTGHWGVIK